MNPGVTKSKYQLFSCTESVVRRPRSPQQRGALLGKFALWSLSCGAEPEAVHGGRHRVLYLTCCWRQNLTESSLRQREKLRLWKGGTWLWPLGSANRVTVLQNFCQMSLFPISICPQQPAQNGKDPSRSRACEDRSQPFRATRRRATPHGYNWYVGRWTNPNKTEESISVFPVPVSSPFGLGLHCL